MFFLALLIGLYGYGIFALGVLSLLSQPFLIGWTVVCLIIFIWYFKHIRVAYIRIPQDMISRTVLLFLVLLACVNFIGVLGPELSFDALWYHLTLPKLYIQEQSMTFMSGGLLYYSAMPKLGELLFIPALAFGSETWAKMIQFLFGILTVVVIYKISRKFVSVPLSLIACLIYYSNIVVAWESTVAYIDLIRAFFESMALLAFVEWRSTRNKKWLYFVSVMTGLAIATKLLALGTVVLFSILFGIVTLSEKVSYQKLVKTLSIYLGIVCAFCLPWFLFSYIHTGNILYPFFTSIYGVTLAQSSQPFLYDFFKLFLFSDDPISPIYMIVFPLIFIYFSRFTRSSKLIGYYCFLALFLWYITPRTGGGRFILPYLPAFSIFVALLLDKVSANKSIYKIVLLSIFFLALVTIGYRGIANSRYIPVIIGSQSKDDFLTKHLNFSYGDFYDTDSYFSTHIKPSDTVLLYGFHNLYYVNFPFVHASYIKKGDSFTYIATQKTELPKQFSDWIVVYENSLTFVTLYKNGEEQWKY